jgi:predicted Zn-dependent protease
MLAGSLAAIGLTQIWKSNHSSQVELEADEMAVRIAQRRGYLETEAARALLQAIERVAEIEGRTSLNFIELVRSQNLRTIGKLSSVAVPDSIRQETR